MMGGFNHGFSLYPDDCPKRRISARGWPEDAAFRASLFDHSAEMGVMQVDLSGRITGDRAFAITKVHDFKFQPMSDAEMAEWWERTR